MAALVWFTMGVALWHFTVFLPDRFWGGIVGAFLGASAGAMVTGAIAQVALGRIGETDMATALSRSRAPRSDSRSSTAMRGAESNEGRPNAPIVARSLGGPGSVEGAELWALSLDHGQRPRVRRRSLRLRGGAPDRGRARSWPSRSRSRSCGAATAPSSRRAPSWRPGRARPDAARGDGRRWSSWSLGHAGAATGSRSTATTTSTGSPRPPSSSRRCASWAPTRLADPDRLGDGYGLAAGRSRS